MNINFDNNFRGAICIMQDNTVLYEKALGFRDLANEIPNNIDTKFASASAGKIFVAVAILQLINNNKISFKSTLKDILDIDLHSIDPNITIEQLLNHTSGVPDYFDESIMTEYEDLWINFPNYKIRHNSDLLPLFIDKPMMYPKGTKFQYNNTGYVILAMIIEKITKMYFDDYIQKNIFNICDMQSTGYYELDKLPPNCANNYIYCSDTNTYRTNIYSVDAKGTGAGGVFITVKDIMSFWNNLLNKKLLPKEMVSVMLSKQNDNITDNKNDYYGYGVWIKENPNSQDFPYFQGCDPGVSFISEYNPNKNIISVLVSNYGDNVWKELQTVRETFY